jgi:hypothetical protein
VAGDLSPQCWNNLTNFITAVRNRGFQEVLLSFFPLNGNDPNGWGAFNSDLYNENRTLILNARQRLAGIGIAYRIDLGNEMTPHSSSPQGLKDYTRILWANFPYKSETVGFSINCGGVGDCRDRIGQMPNVYQGNYPPVLSLHIYRGYYPDDAYNVYIQAWYKLRDMGLGAKPWIIGEASYNDGAEAAALTQAQQGLGNTVYYLTQWPLYFPSGDANPPLSYYEYSSRGW